MHLLLCEKKYLKKYKKLRHHAVGALNVKNAMQIDYVNEKDIDYNQTVNF